MISTIKEINKLLENEGKEINTDNIIEKVKSGGIIAFEMINFIHKKEVQYYKNKISELEEKIKKLQES